jgi:putative FmdB family regulatory protein
MPIYEYRCRSCSSEFEELVRSAEGQAAVSCPKCGKRQVERRLSVFAARDAAPASLPAMPGGCGRCGDPRGSCGV